MRFVCLFVCLCVCVFVGCCSGDGRHAAAARTADCAEQLGNVAQRRRVLSSTECRPVPRRGVRVGARSAVAAAAAHDQRTQSHVVRCMLRVVVRCMPHVAPYLLCRVRPARARQVGRRLSGTEAKWGWGCVCSGRSTTSGHRARYWTCPTRTLAEDDNSEECAILCESGARSGVLWFASEMLCYVTIRAQLDFK